MSTASSARFSMGAIDHFSLEAPVGGAFLRGAIRSAFERLTGTRIYRTLPHGVDVLADIRRLLPNYSPRVMFDVGANVGQSAKAMLARFPLAEIYCYEPVSSTFKLLQANTRRYRNVRCIQCAVGDKCGQAAMALHESSVYNKLISEPGGPGAVEGVAVETLVTICGREGIDQIDYLKVDTEGHDFQVLAGGEEFFDQGTVRVLQLEAGMSSINELHVPLRRFTEFLEPRGYVLFGLYDQKHEAFTGDPRLRRADAVFLHAPSIPGWI